DPTSAGLCDRNRQRGYRTGARMARTGDSRPCARARGATGRQGHGIGAGQGNQQRLARNLASPAGGGGRPAGAGGGGARKKKEFLAVPPSSGPSGHLLPPAGEGNVSRS